MPEVDESTAGGSGSDDAETLAISNLVSAYRAQEELGGSGGLDVLRDRFNDFSPEDILATLNPIILRFKEQWNVKELLGPLAESLEEKMRELGNEDPVTRAGSDPFMLQFEDIADEVQAQLPRAIVLEIDEFINQTTSELMSRLEITPGTIEINQNMDDLSHTSRKDIQIAGLSGDNTQQDIESVIQYQLYSCHHISQTQGIFSARLPAGQIAEPSVHIDALESVFTFTSSEFIYLLDTLKVPFLSTVNQRTPSAPVVVGTGGFSNVKYDNLTTEDTALGIAVAIKEFKPTSDDPRTLNRIDALSINTITQCFVEVSIMKHPRLSTHPNILRLIGITENLAIPRLSGSSSQLSLITEFSDYGSLYTCIDRTPYRFTWKVKCQVICDIAEGLQAIHACGIVHNDIKSQNVLLFSHSPEREFVAKISDFGCSVPLPLAPRMKAAAATTIYGAPEAYSIDIVDPSRDVYAFGLLIIHVLGGEEPFKGRTEEEIYEMKQNPALMADYVRSVSHSTLALENTLIHMLDAHPESRFSELSSITHLLGENKNNSDLLHAPDPSKYLPDHCVILIPRIPATDDLDPLGARWFCNLLSRKRSPTTEILHKQVAYALKQSDSSFERSIPKTVPPSGASMNAYLPKQSSMQTTKTRMRL